MNSFKGITYAQILTYAHILTDAHILALRTMQEPCDNSHESHVLSFFCLNFNSTASAPRFTFGKWLGMSNLVGLAS